MNDNMDVDMDVDLVVDEEEDEELAQLRRQAEEARARGEADLQAAPEPTQEAREEGELQNSDVVPNKVHISGLDSLTTADIRNFVSDHYSLDNFKRVEWIDDTSANLIFENDDVAASALQALTDGDDAKALATHPDVELHLRLATVSDVKLPGAKDRSRFYLLNPEYDPDMRPRRKNARRRRDRRQSSPEEKPFDVNLYDDTVELMPKRDHGRLRDRSASPVADGDGNYGFKEQPYRRTARPTSPTRNSNKELFPGKPHPNALADALNDHSLSKPEKRDLFSRISGGPREGRLNEEPDREGFSILGASKENPLVKELFPMKMQTKNAGRELFDGRVKGRATQRRRAEDLF